MQSPMMTDGPSTRTHECEARHRDGLYTGTLAKVAGCLFLSALLVIGSLTNGSGGYSAPVAVDVAHDNVAAGMHSTAHPRVLPHTSDYAKQNTALILVRWHASTHTAVRMICRHLRKAGISIVRRRRLSGESIADRDIFEEATIIQDWQYSDSPDSFDMPADKKALFKQSFGDDWDDVRTDGSLKQLWQVASTLGLSDVETTVNFYELEEGIDRLHIGYGFDVGKLGGMYLVSPAHKELEDEFEDDDWYFYAFEVSWKPHVLSYIDYLSNVIGNSTPAKSHPSSIRHQMWLNWKDLEFKFRPNGFFYGVETSPNLYAAMQEAAAWFEDTTMADHPIHKELERRGVDFSEVESLLLRPFITYHGQEKHFYDFLYGLDRKPFMKMFVDIVGALAHTEGS